MIVFHDQITDADISYLQSAGILGGTRFKVLPMVYVTATKAADHRDLAQPARAVDLRQPDA